MSLLKYLVGRIFCSLVHIPILLSVFLFLILLLFTLYLHLLISVAAHEIS